MPTTPTPKRHRLTDTQRVIRALMRHAGIDEAELRASYPTLWQIWRKT